MYGRIILKSMLGNKMKRRGLNLYFPGEIPISSYCGLCKAGNAYPANSVFSFLFLGGAPLVY
jgi:hypothetical protein